MVQQNSQYSSEKTATLCWSTKPCTKAVASAVTAGSVAAGGGCEGVLSARAFSSSVMSAGMSSKSGVER